MTNRQISVHLDVKLKSNYDYKKTVLNYLDKLIAGINQATPATPAPQDNGGDVDADATLPTAPGSAAAAVAGDASVAGPDAANVSQGAGAGRTGDGASYEDKMKELELKMAEMNYQRAAQIAELDVKQKGHMVKLEVRQKELEVQQKKDTVETQGQLNKYKIAISEVKLGLTKVGATADRADSKADEALESSNNANERVGDIEYKVNGLTDTVKKLLLSKPVDSDEGDQLARLVGDASFSPTPSHTAPAAAVDESDDNFDEVEVNNNIITPAPGPTSFASRLFPDAAPFYPDNYRAFLRLLKEARRYGQDGKEMEMNSSLKKAEHIMLNTKLNEERNRWHTDFNNMSKCARKLCREYGLKPAARYA